MITWRETSPSEVAHERIAGAGSALIQRLAKDLGGTAQFNFAPTGLQAVITFEAEG